ncbi:MAG: hypothetical protein NTX94_02585 [Caldiserica bacterium]|nr:hypothetical protein [Caldisericota bacterium]
MKDVLLSIQGNDPPEDVTINPKGVSLQELLRSRSRYLGRQGPMELGGVTGLVK